MNNMKYLKSQTCLAGRQVLNLKIIVFAVFMVFIFTGCITRTPVISRYDDFAKCLKEKNVTMYGSYSCSHCQTQKLKFGSSFQYVPYVECMDNVALCNEKNINGFPTWIFQDGKRIEGAVELDEIAQVSGCALPAVK